MWTVPQVPDESALRRCVCGMRDEYPFLTAGCIGRSRAGRPILSLSLGGGDGCVLLCGGFHGSEWLTPLLLLRFCEELCRSVQTGIPLCGADVEACLARREVLLVPCVNPDGTEIFLHGPRAAGTYEAHVRRLWNPRALWNANAVGVDVNHNFDAGWELLRQTEREHGITGPAPRRYGGERPESEPETRALCNLCRKRKPVHALAFHSQGEEIFWRYGRIDPPRAGALLHVLVSASGYTPAENADLYAHGGFKDWFIKTFQRPAFTVEIGKGRNPLPLGDFEEIYEKLREMLTLAAFL